MLDAVVLLGWVLQNWAKFKPGLSKDYSMQQLLLSGKDYSSYDASQIFLGQNLTGQFRL